MKRYWRIIFAAIILLLIIIVVFAIHRSRKSDSQAFQHNRAISVKVEKPIRRLMMQELEYTGDVSAIQQANIFPKVSGNIEEIYVDIGTDVRRNQLLAIIDTTELYQQVQETSATFVNNRLNYERIRKLLGQNLVAKEDLDNADTAMKIAQANLETAKTQLYYAYIRAPFTGFITKRFLDPGTFVAPGNVILFTLMNIDSVKVAIDVVEKDVPYIPRLHKATITVQAIPDQKFEGTVSRYSQAVDLNTRTMPVEIIVPNREHELKPGMFVTAALVIAEHANTITVPTQAVLKDNQGTYVFIVEGAKAKRIAVETGIEKNSLMEITGGLTGTENIITTGQQFVKNDGPVSVQH